MFGFYPEEQTFQKWELVRGTLSSIVSIVFIIDIIVPVFSNVSVETIKNSGVWITEIAFALKLSIFLYNRNIILKIERALGTPILKHFSQDSLNQIVGEIKLTQKFCTFYRYTIISYITLFIIASLSNPLSNERQLLYNGYSPCNLTNNINYVGLLIVQATFGYITALVNINIELFFSCLITIACCLFGILKYNLKNIDYTQKQSVSELRANIILHIETLR